MTYKEKLLDPRWQKMRLELLSEANYTCQLCGDNKTTLHIHHFSYSKSRNPWDVSPLDLAVYCKHCHALVESQTSLDIDVHKVIKDFTIKEEVKIIVYYVYGGNRHIIEIYKYDEKTNKITSFLLFSAETLINNINEIEPFYNSVKSSLDGLNK